VVEAKDVASGACACSIWGKAGHRQGGADVPAGRNGGHIAPHGFSYIDTLCKPLEEGGAGLTEEEALAIHFFELENLACLDELVQREGIDAEFRNSGRIEGGLAWIAEHVAERPLG
jgi:hypothetical protein